MSLFDNLHKGALHRELGVPEDEPIPGGKRKMNQICHGSIGDRIVVGNHEVTINKKMKQRACFASNFGYGKKY